MGSFMDVSDDGLICGVSKDTEYLLTVSEWGETDTLPLNVAAVWNLEGSRTSLGLGTYSVSDFTHFTDGTFATSISRDGKVVAGYVAIGNYAWCYPCRWVLNETTGQYEFAKYVVPENCNDAMVTDISGDGSIAVGYCKKSWNFYACYWPTVDSCVVFDNDSIASGHQGSKSYVISDNGRYIALTPDGLTPMIYDLQNLSLKKIGYYDQASSVEIGSITDDGNVVGTFSYGRTNRIRPFWYNNEFGIMTDFSYFVYRTAQGLDLPYTFDSWSGEQLSFCSTSADGSVILGNESYGKPWMLKVATMDINDILPTVTSELNLSMVDIGKVKVSFERASEHYMNFDAQDYVVYRDGQEVGRISIDSLGADDKVVALLDTNVTDGTHYYTVAINYKNVNDGSTLLSPMSLDESFYMESDIEFPLYDDFSSLSSNGWSVERDYGETLYQNWGCPPYMGLNGSNCLYSAVDQLIPYSFSCVSRHIDARDKEQVYISFARVWGYVNSYDWPLDKDTLSLEVKAGDSGWQVVKDFRLDDVHPGYWSFEYIDLTSYAAGKLFQVRFHLHGQAEAQYVWEIDNLTIDEKPQHEPVQDIVTLATDDNKFHIAWKNSINAYPLSYLVNPYFNVTTLAVGNESNPFIAVNQFDAADLKPFAGKYLTSITTELNKYDNNDGVPERAAIVVYLDNELVCEQEIVDTVYNADITVKLDNPVLIDGTKELKFGLKLLEYGAEQCPFIYQNTKKFVDKKSNLYSEDNGVTWKSLADYYATVTDHETDGDACWYIIGNVTDEKDITNTEINSNQYGYEVYKNGEKYTNLFVYFIEPGFTDTASVVGDTYQIRTFYYDGTVSELSEPVTNNGVDAIKSVLDDNAITYRENGESEIAIDGQFDSAYLVNTSGMIVSRNNGEALSLRGLSEGVYILVVEKEGKKLVRKIVIE
ncbi:MAG: hypothetical protein ACOYJG_07850 [Prevotella sp.]